jgi:hypothetical protein
MWCHFVADESLKRGRNVGGVMHKTRHSWWSTLHYVNTLLPSVKLVHHPVRAAGCLCAWCCVAFSVGSTDHGMLEIILHCVSVCVCVGLAVLTWGPLFLIGNTLL